MEAEVLLMNEFAGVRVSVDRAGHSPRILLEDLQTGSRRWLDPLVLACLARADDKTLERFLDPAALDNRPPGGERQR